MTSPRNAGDGKSFFASQNKSPSNVNLVTTQLNPNQPQIQALSLITDPIISGQHSSVNVSNFDPNLYNLDDSSHLMRLIRALITTAGVGGIKKQTAISRLSSTLAGSNFTDLDGFYGALFGMSRNIVEQMPTNVNGTIVNPFTDVAPVDIWDQIQSVDARYRSRIIQLARAIALGATKAGIKAASEAILSCPVDVFESWIKVDLLNNQQVSQAIGGFTFGYMTSHYVIYGNIDNLSYNFIEGDQFGAGNTPAGNRGEVIISPRRVTTIEEQYQLMRVLRVLKSSNTQITISSTQSNTYMSIPALNYSSDSEYWQVVSSVNPNPLVNSGTDTLYPNQGTTVARPVHSQYSGEGWSYNGNVIKVSSYQINQGIKLPGTDDQTIVYADGVGHTYVGSDGVMDKAQAISQRLSADGVMTSYPYAGNRILYGSS